MLVFWDGFGRAVIMATYGTLRRRRQGIERISGWRSAGKCERSLREIDRGRNAFLLNVALAPTCVIHGLSRPLDSSVSSSLPMLHGSLDRISPKGKVFGLWLLRQRCKQPLFMPIPLFRLLANELDLVAFCLAFTKSLDLVLSLKITPFPPWN